MLQDHRPKTPQAPQSKPVPPNQTPPSDVTTPRYDLPQFSKPHSPLPPPSPSNEAVKRRRVLNQNRQSQQTQPPEQEQDQDQNMAVDEESEHPVDPRETPTDRDKAQRQGKTTMDQDNLTRNATDKGREVDQNKDIFVEVNEKEKAKTMARILNIDEPSSELDPTLPPHPLDKFTKGPMPQIFDEDPATLLAGLERNQLQAWLDLPTGKVLARPFDIEVRYKPNHSNIANLLRSTVKEITGATKVTVALPKRDPNLPRDGTLKYPMTFLIHDISKKDEEALLDRTVWSSKEITFQVSPIYVKRPDFLFTIEKMTTDNPLHVLACIGETWNDSITNNFIHKLINATPNKEEQQDRLSEIVEFLESATVRHLDVRSEGGQENPHYNVYADGEVIQNNKTWLELRRFLRNRIYRSNYHGDGKATDMDFICSLCHGHDHPRGLCAFPHIPGWNGGGRNPKRPPIFERYGESEHQDSPQSAAQLSTHARGSSRSRFSSHGRGRGYGRTATRYTPH